MVKMEVLEEFFFIEFVVVHDLEGFFKFFEEVIIVRFLEFQVQSIEEFIALSARENAFLNSNPNELAS